MQQVAEIEEELEENQQLQSQKSAMSIKPKSQISGNLKANLQSSTPKVEEEIIRVELPQE